MPKLSLQRMVRSSLILCGFGAMLALIAGAVEPPKAPEVSTFASATDLVNQANKYMSELENSIASIENGEEKFEDLKEKIGKDANTLVVIALSLGLHDEGNSLKAHAGALMKSAQQMAASTDLNSAKKAFAEVKAAAEGTNKVDATLKWEKVASLPDLMKQVPTINTKLKMAVKPTKFKAKAKESAGHTAVLAAIAQASVFDTSPAKTPEQEKQWYQFCEQMRNEASAMNKAIHAGDVEATDKALTKLGVSCEDCHKVFKPDAVIE